MIKCVVDNKVCYMNDADSYSIRSIKFSISRRIGIDMNNRLCVFDGQVINDLYIVHVKENTVNTIFFLTREQYIERLNDVEHFRILDNRAIMREHRKIKSNVDKTIKFELGHTLSITTIPPASKSVSIKPLPKFWSNKV